MSESTATRRTESLADAAKEKLDENLSDGASLAVDESTDLTDKAQLMLCEVLCQI